MYFQKKNTRECLDCCNNLLRRGHEQILAVCLKARILNLVSGYAQALEFLDPYIRNNPTNDALFIVLAEIQECSGNYSAAVEALQNAKHMLEQGKGLHYADNLRFVDERLRQLVKIRRP